MSVKRRVLGVAAAALALAMFAGVDPAHALTGTGIDVTLAGTRTVVGAGSYVVAGGSTVTVAFECRVAAVPDPVSASIRPPSSGGCVLKRNGVVIASAPGRSLPGAVAATAATGSFALAGTQSVDVCWNVYASFVDGDLVSNTHCESVSVLDEAPAVPPVPNPGSIRLPVPEKVRDAIEALNLPPSTCVLALDQPC